MNWLRQFVLILTLSLMSAPNGTHQVNLNQILLRIKLDPYEEVRVSVAEDFRDQLIDIWTRRLMASSKVFPVLSITSNNHLCQNR